MEPPGVTFTLQWRKLGNASRRNITKIGLWDPDNSKLDWRTFKIYVCQNLGTVEDINLSYIDSSEEDVPIESEQDFRNALAFARKRARNGKETVLRIHQKNPVVTNLPKTVVPGHVKSVVNTLLASSSKNNKTPIEPSFKSISRKNSSKSLESVSNQEKVINRGNKINFIAEKFEPKNKEHTEVLMTLLDKLQKLNLDPADTPPSWFHSYMRKFKGEIIAEVTTNFLQEVQQTMRYQTDYNETRNSHSCNLNKNAYRQKVITQLLSCGEIPSDSNEFKLLKEIEKLRKREKKLERKFDFKLRKLEHKTKKIIEKRSRDRMPYRRLCSLQRSGEIHISTCLMDAVLLNECKEVIVSPGEHFTKVWEVKNTGNLPWTDKTELRQVWGSNGLEPENTVAEVPPLQPGETGTILMEFRAPEYTGSSNSYWHFHHKGERFGHWLACSVIVKGLAESPLTSLHDLECDLTKRNIQHNMFANFCPKDKIDDSNLERNMTLIVQDTSRKDIFEGSIESEASKVSHFPKSGAKKSEKENAEYLYPIDRRSTQLLTDNIDAVFKSLLDEPVPSDIRIDENVENNNSTEESEKPGFDNSTHTKFKLPNDSYKDTFREKVYVVDPLGRCFAFKPPNPFSKDNSSDICSLDDPCGSCFAFSYATNLHCPKRPKITVLSDTRMNGTPRTQSQTSKEKQKCASPKTNLSRTHTPTSKEKRQSTSPTANLSRTHSPTSKEKRQSTSPTANLSRTHSPTSKEKRQSTSPTANLSRTQSRTSKEKRQCTSPTTNLSRTPSRTSKEKRQCTSATTNLSRTRSPTSKEKRPCTSATSSLPRTNSTCEEHLHSNNMRTNQQGANRVSSSTRSSKTNFLLNNSMNNRGRTRHASPTSRQHRPRYTDRENVFSDDSYSNAEDTTRASRAKSTNNNVSFMNMMNTFPASLATGAASMATTALKAARSVVNNCRESLQEHRQRPDRRTDITKNLDLLEKMGFKDSLLNFQLLHKHNNDLNKVLSVLLTITEDD